MGLLPKVAKPATPNYCLSHEFESLTHKVESLITTPSYQIDQWFYLFKAI